MQTLPKVLVVKPEVIEKRHPWLFSEAVEPLEKIEEGQRVVVLGPDRHPIAMGHYHHGTIRVKIFHWGTPVEVNENFWFEKLRRSYKRRILLNIPHHTNAFRIVHGEADMFPGLTMDYYNGVVSMAVYSEGMWQEVTLIASAIKKVLDNRVKAIYVRRHTGRETISQLIEGNAENPIMCEENDIKFLVDWKHGQKTGHFLDQRDNRLFVRRYARGKVLDLFSYSGGFSLNALKGKAQSVTIVDSSERALELAKENIKLNFNNANVEFIKQDVFDFLKETNERWDTIICDPPAFTKHVRTLPQAVRAYTKLNRQVISKLNNTGFLFTFSCSQVVVPELFRKIVFWATQQANRNTTIVHHLHQAADHPESVFHPEGLYLKGIMGIVE
ncbi:MAG: class I SAM-dependent rRNA methyltransferase [Chlorobi bacterium]|nr:class I SAM-dependent rRNA methyltransferase [Chlorobiota bacterium]